ncbi:hypothetical protein POM88_039805 [Heracleum sosnowskyi]|uniref:F-box domain-containing protein n=1 Tax=Heracleum sosnowskyi TaxID=360622 RepID=A0AAD8HDC5_9APIA|nr:hypothetical protein POM88_039805 [Heracleum sosnowskyi]
MLMWRAISGCLPTKDRLRVKHVNVNVVCSLCNSEVESTEHLFLDCSFAKSCWITAGISWNFNDQMSFRDWAVKEFNEWCSENLCVKMIPSPAQHYNLPTTVTRVDKLQPSYVCPKFDKIMEDQSAWNEVLCRKKRKTIASSGKSVDNFINELPEELLVSIISLLPLREAARTTIISRRWRYLWRKCLHLDFNYKNIRGKSDVFQVFAQHLQAEFVEQVQKTIELFCGESLETFKLDYVLSEEYGCLIDQWVEFAMKKHVQKLSISLGTQKISPPPVISLKQNLSSLFENGKTYKFPYWIFNERSGSRLRQLSLNYCKLTLHRTFDNFKSLTSLSIKNTELPEKIVQNILENCSRLEWLSITHCSCLGRLKFAATVLQWNKAQLSRLCFGSVWRSVPVPSHALSNISIDFPEIKSLLLTFDTVQETMIPNMLPPFNELKHLILVFRSLYHPKAFLKFVSLFVRASPFMQKLELHFPGCHPPMKLNIREFDKHEHLKELELYNFLGGDSHVVVAKYVVKSAIALEKVKVCYRALNYKGDGEWSDIYKHKRNYEGRIRKKLRGIVRANIQLTVA